MPTPLTWLTSLVAAVESHDLPGLSEHFAEDYVNRTPAHPGRSFTGRGQVTQNWSRLFGAMPDLRGIVLASTAEGSRVWSEWELRGHRADGELQVLAGVIVFEVHDGLATAARFYLEPVDAGDDGVDGAVGRVIGVQP